MRGLADDVANDGITANAVLSGLTNTLATAPQSEEQKRATWEQQAIKRLGEPEDMRGAILFLTRDHAAFITGHAFVVDDSQYRIAYRSESYSTMSRMSRFSKISPAGFPVSRTATSTMARAKSSAGIT